VGVVEQALPDTELERAAIERIGSARVVASPDIVCGTCDMCRGGLRHHCRMRRSLGRAGVDGGLAERVLVPITNLHAVPKDVDDDAALFALPLAAALHCAQHVHLEGKTYITVLGDDAVALLGAQVMAKRNASVRVVGDDVGRLELCEKWGVRHRPLADVGRRADQDVVIECTGSAERLRTAARLVRPRGVIVCRGGAEVAGEHGPPASAIVEHELTIHGSRGYPIAEALRLLAAGEVETHGLISRRATLAQAESALRHAASAETITAVVDCG
jgi:threonine dehydrogenase-like Zn-dependent dehydrogenase